MGREEPDLFRRRPRDQDPKDGAQLAHELLVHADFRAAAASPSPSSPRARADAGAADASLLVAGNASKVRPVSLKRALGRRPDRHFGQALAGGNEQLASAIGKAVRRGQLSRQVKGNANRHMPGRPKGGEREGKRDARTEEVTLGELELRRRERRRRFACTKGDWS